MWTRAKDFIKDLLGIRTKNGDLHYNEGGGFNKSVHSSHHTPPGRCSGGFLFGLSVLMLPSSKENHKITLFLLAERFLYFPEIIDIFFIKKEEFRYGRILEYSKETKIGKKDFLVCQKEQFKLQMRIFKKKF